MPDNFDFDDEALPPPERIEGRQAYPNQPCPCGSGRKYKRCCGRPGGMVASRPAPASSAAPIPGPGSAPAPVRTAAEDEYYRPRKVSQKLTRRLVGEARKLLSDRELNQAAGRWSGNEASYMRLLEGGDAEAGAFMEYVIHDWRPEGGKTIVERFVEREGRWLSSEERRQVEAWLHQRRYGWFEVESVEPATSYTTLRERLAGGFFRVYDRALSGMAHRGDTMIGAIFPCGERMEIGGYLTQAPRSLRVPFEAWLRREHEAWRKASAAADAESAQSWSRFMSERGAEVHGEMLRLAELPPLLLLPTGEQAAYSYAVYEVLDRPAALAALKSLPALRHQGRGEGNEVKGEDYGWIHRRGAEKLPFERPVPEKGECERPVMVVGMSRVSTDAPAAELDPLSASEDQLGTVFLGADRMEIQAYSRERLTFVRQAVEAKLGGTVRELHTKEQSPDFIDKLWQERGQREPEDRRIAKPPKMRRIEEQLQASMESGWLDLPVKGLDGKTPRQAAADPRLRPELEAILRDFEQQAREAPPGAKGGWGPDFTASVRRELGMG